MKKIIAFLTIVIFLATILTATLNLNVANAQTVDAPTLDPNDIPKFVNQLVIPPVYVPTYSYDCKTHTKVQNYKVDMTQFTEQILPTTYANGTPTGFGQTKVWGYGGYVKDPLTGKFLGFVQNSPGPTFEVTRGTPARVTYENKITSSSIFAVDPTIHWANPNNMPMMPNMPWPTFPPGFPDAQSPVPLVTHLHGGEVRSDSDGGPEAWFTATGLHGPTYSTNIPTSADSTVYYYPNEQLPTTLWYHDHALGMTRLNVMSGLAGFYMLRDPTDPIEHMLPDGKYEIPIAIQDRSFNLDGSMWFPSEGVNPDVHPYWQPEFFGNTIMVNGKLWPNLNVDRGQYRLHLLDGSNARFYNMTFMVKETGKILPFTVIGTEGGFIKSPVTLSSILIAPAERPDVLVDFSKLKTGQHVIITNNAPAPYPMGDMPDENTGVIMQFTVTAHKGEKAVNLPCIINPTLKNQLPNPQNNKRLLTLKEIEGDNGPLMVTLNGQTYNGVLTETPRVGSTEDWYFINLTPDTHPMHLHLVQFQLVKRIPFNATAYATDWIALNNNMQLPFPDNYKPKTLDPAPYITGAAALPTPQELAWKDTIQSPTGWITVIRVRFAPQDSPLTGPHAPKPGVNQFPFDPTIGPGYVWHCHIIDHEDNEMMRPYKVKN